jgi:hypothetical protein
VSALTSGDGIVLDAIFSGGSRSLIDLIFEQESSFLLETEKTAMLACMFNKMSVGIDSGLQYSAVSRSCSIYNPKYPKSGSA